MSLYLLTNNGETALKGSVPAVVGSVNNDYTLTTTPQNVAGLPANNSTVNLAGQATIPVVAFKSVYLKGHANSPDIALDYVIVKSISQQQPTIGNGDLQINLFAIMPNRQGEVAMSQWKDFNPEETTITTGSPEIRLTQNTDYTFIVRVRKKNGAQITGKSLQTSLGVSSIVFKNSNLDALPENLTTINGPVITFGNDATAAELAAAPQLAVDYPRVQPSGHDMQPTLDPMNRNQFVLKGTVTPDAQVRLTGLKLRLIPGGGTTNEATLRSALSLVFLKEDKNHVVTQLSPDIFEFGNSNEKVFPVNGTFAPSECPCTIIVSAVHNLAVELQADQTFALEIADHNSFIFEHTVNITGDRSARSQYFTLLGLTVHQERNHENLIIPTQPTTMVTVSYPHVQVSAIRLAAELPENDTKRRVIRAVLTPDGNVNLTGVKLKLLPGAGTTDRAVLGRSLGIGLSLVSAAGVERNLPLQADNTFGDAEEKTFMLQPGFRFTQNGCPCTLYVKAFHKEAVAQQQIFKLQITGRSSYIFSEHTVGVNGDPRTETGGYYTLMPPVNNGRNQAAAVTPPQVQKPAGTPRANFITPYNRNNKNIFGSQAGAKSPPANNIPLAHQPAQDQQNDAAPAEVPDLTPDIPPADTPPVDQPSVDADVTVSFPSQPAALNDINLDSLFVPVYALHLVPNKLVEVAQLHLALNSGDANGILPPDVEFQLFKSNNGFETPVSQPVVANSLGEINFANIQAGIFTGVGVGQDLIVKAHVLNHTTAYGKTFSLGFWGTSDLVLSDPAATVGVEGVTPFIGQVMTVMDAPAGVADGNANAGNGAGNVDPVVPPVVSCPGGLFPYTGPPRAGVAQCIACPTDVFIRNNGSCFDPTGVVSAQDILNQALAAQNAARAAAAAAGQRQTPAPQTPEPKTPAPQTPAPQTRADALAAAARAAAAQQAANAGAVRGSAFDAQANGSASLPNLAYSQRLIRAPERGSAGPEAEVYMLFAALSPAAVALWRRRK